MKTKKRKKAQLTVAQRKFQERAKFVEVQKNHLNDAAEIIDSAYNSLTRSSIKVEPLRQAYEVVIDVIVGLVDKYLISPEDREKRDQVLSPPKVKVKVVAVEE